MMKPFKEVVLTLQNHNEKLPRRKLQHQKLQHKLKRRKTKKKPRMKMKKNLLRVKKKLKQKGENLTTRLRSFCLSLWP